MSFGFNALPKGSAGQFSYLFAGIPSSEFINHVHYVRVSIRTDSAKSGEIIANLPATAYVGRLPDG